MAGKMRSWSRALRLRRFAKDERGVAAIEFALVLPIMALLLLGCFEVPRFVMVYQKIARTSSGVADLVAQADDPITSAQMTDVFSASKMMMQPYDVAANGVVIVSSINNPTGGTGVKITWQRRNGTVTTLSKLGIQGATPVNVPAGLTPALDEELLTAEVYFNYTPIFKTQIYQGSQLYLISYTRPRNHNLMIAP